MDYEKAYNEALERAKSFQEKYGGDYAGYIFPELRESEDERIRKFLVDYFASYKIGNVTTKLNGVRIDDILNYLKKQKDQKPEHFELKAGKWYICHRAFCCRADHLTVKEGERFMCEKDGVVKGFIIKEPEKYFIECSAPAPMGDEQKEQNPVEWSANDKAIVNCIVCCLDGQFVPEAARKQSLEWFNKHRRDFLNQTEQEWSEEDEEMMTEIIEFLEYAYPYDNEFRIAWLKSLRGRPKSSDNWKPSEEQMKALDKAIPVCIGVVGRDEVAPLESLYEQLKKL